MAPRILSLEEKIRIIQESEKAPFTPRKLAFMFGLRMKRGLELVKDILKNKEDLKEMAGQKLDSYQTFPNIGGYKLDRTVYLYCRSVLLQKIPVTESLIRGFAADLASNLKVKNFAATESWLACFCRRHRISLNRLYGRKKPETPKVPEPQLQESEAAISEPFVDSTNNHLNPTEAYDIKTETWTKTEPEIESEPMIIEQEIKVLDDDQSSVISIASSSENNVLPVSQSAEAFFHDIEREMEITIPPYLKNALIYTGYDNAASLRHLDDTDFEEMQNFVRNQFTELFGSRNVALEDYFGIFSHNIKQFQILPGHRKLLLAISNSLSDRNDTFSNRASNKSTVKKEVCR